MLLMIGEFMVSTTVTKAGGGFGILTAFIAYYVAASGVINPTTSYVSSLSSTHYTFGGLNTPLHSTPSLHPFFFIYARSAFLHRLTDV